MLPFNPAPFLIGLVEKTQEALEATPPDLEEARDALTLLSWHLSCQRAGHLYVKLTLGAPPTVVAFHEGHYYELVERAPWTGALVRVQVHTPERLPTTELRRAELAILRARKHVVAHLGEESGGKLLEELRAARAHVRARRRSLGIPA